MATYRKLPAGIDPIAWLMQEERLCVAACSLQPGQIAQLYENLLALVKVEQLRAKGEDMRCGLESLPRLLRHEPGQQHKWLELRADTKLIQTSLPPKTPYQLLYLRLWGLEIPSWNDMPRQLPESISRARVLGSIESEGLLFGKNRRLYLATALWSPAEEYFGGDREPRWRDDEPYVFNLTRLTVEEVDWRDPRILAHIRREGVYEIQTFVSRLKVALLDTASVLEWRANAMQQVARTLDQLPIRYGQ